MNNVEILLHEDINNNVSHSLLCELEDLLNRYTRVTNTNIKVIGILKMAFRHNNYADNSYEITLLINNENVFRHSIIFNHLGLYTKSEIINRFLKEVVIELQKFFFLSNSEYNINNMGILS